MQKYILYIVCVLLLQSCKDNKNVYAPPEVKFEHIRVIDSLSSFIDSVYYNVSTLTVNKGARLEITCKTAAEGNYEQMDIVVYGLTKKVDNTPLDTAYILNSFGKKTSLTGNSMLDWPNTSFRSGFMTDKSDSITVVVPVITNQTSMVVLVTDRNGLSNSGNLIVNIY